MTGNDSFEFHAQHTHTHITHSVARVREADVLSEQNALC